MLEKRPPYHELRAKQKVKKEEINEKDLVLLKIKEKMEALRLEAEKGENVNDREIQKLDEIRRRLNNSSI